MRCGEAAVAKKIKVVAALHGGGSVKPMSAVGYAIEASFGLAIDLLVLLKLMLYHNSSNNEY